jgi:diamine N-acetyltransferase
MLCQSLGTGAPKTGGRYQLDLSNKPLEELVKDLSPELGEQVREYVEYLLAGLSREPDTPAPTDTLSGSEVSLRQITEDSVRDICRLSDTLTPPKKYMVAPNAVSIAQAHFSEHAWFRAIYAGDAPVGFIMLYDDPEEPEFFLWRLMVAGQYHGRGFGRRAIELLVDYVKTRPGAKVLETSCGQGPGSPEGFYKRIGFERNGKTHGEEVGLSLALR